MIWYRHWLELRWRLPWVLAGGVLLGLWPQDGLWDNMHRWPGDTASVPADSAAWFSFVSRAWLLSFMGAIVLSGNGFRTWYMDSVGPSDVSLAFTLSLPLSRTRLMWTRMIGSWVAVAGALAAATLTQFAWLSLAGQPVPVSALTASAAMLAVAAAAWVVVCAALLMPTRLVWGVLAYVPAVLVCSPLTISAATTWTAGGRSPWLALAALAVIAAACAAYMRRAARTREFA